jgi:hypothetical protein
MHASRRIRPSRQPRSIDNNEIRGLAQASSGRIRSRGAIALGILLAIGTIVVLFWDVRTPADITTDHVMTLAMLVVTIAAGHYWLPAVQQRRVLPAIGLAILFIAGTFVCVTGSAGRGAEVAQRKAAAAGNINEARKEIADQLAKARSDHALLSTAMIKECASGEGPKCRGARTSVEYADSHIAILEVRKNDMAPEQEANVRLKHAARVFAFFNPGADVRRIEQGLELIWPFALALIMELGTIVFIGFGLGHGRSAYPVAGSIDAAPADPNSPTKGRCGRKSDPAVLDFIERFRKLHGRPPTGAQIRTEFPDLPKSTAYDVAARASKIGRNSGRGLRVVGYAELLRREPFRC